MVVDFHVHCFPDDIACKAIPSLAACAGISAHTDGTVAGITKSMEDASIDHSVVLSIATKPSQTVKINDWAAGIQRRDITAFGSIHPEYPLWKEELRRIKGLGLKGIKLHPEYQSFYVDDSFMFPFYECAFSLGLIIVFHSGVDIGMPAPYHCEPKRLCRIIEAFPGAVVVAAHMGGFNYWNDTERYLVGRDIYLDTSYSLKHMGREQAVRIIGNHGSEKVLFATDSPWGGQAEEVKLLQSLKLKPDAESAIFGGNAQRLLGLSTSD